MFVFQQAAHPPGRGGACPPRLEHVEVPVRTGQHTNTFSCHLFVQRITSRSGFFFLAVRIKTQGLQNSIFLKLKQNSPKIQFFGNSLFPGVK